MRRTSRVRRRALMIDTTDGPRQSSVRRLRRKMPLPSWFRNIAFGKFSTWGIIGCTGMALFVGIAVLSPVFRINTFTVERTSPFVDSALVEEKLQEFRGKNLIFLRHTDIVSFLAEAMPELREIDITEDWPRSLIVRVGAAKPIYNIFNIETANFSVISENGIVLQTQSIEGLPVIKIHQREEPIFLRERILTASQLLQIHEAEGLLDTDLRLPINAVEILLQANELHIVSREGMVIWIDLSRSVQEQIQKLKAAENKIKLYSDTFEHIDLRIPEQIFWKTI